MIAERKSKAPCRKFTGSSFNAVELAASPSLELAYIVAAPRMAYYMTYSTRIYDIYLKYIAPEDMHVYSIDEVFMDVTAYLSTYKMTAHELALKMIRDVLGETGVTATAGIGSNMYLYYYGIWVYYQLQNSGDKVYSFGRWIGWSNGSK